MAEQELGPEPEEIEAPAAEENPNEEVSSEETSDDEIAAEENSSESVAGEETTSAPIDLTEHRLGELSRKIEALLFLSPESVGLEELATAIEAPVEEIEVALAALQEQFAPGKRGIRLREVAGGWTFVTDPEAEGAARRLLTKPRTPPLTQAQAESLAIVAYLQPVARPEIARIRGVASDSALNALTERGLIEEAGRSRFGAVIYTTTPLFLRLFGLGELGELPDPSKFDPTPEDEREIRERLIKAGEQRAGADQ